MAFSVTTTYLQSLSRQELRASVCHLPDLHLARVPSPMPELNRFFYTAIGGDWFWYERLPWTYARWMEYLSAPGIETWILSAMGIPAGYFELDAQPDGSTEIAYFGLLPQYVGKGLGGYLLTQAIERAWDAGAKRVWVHTCTQDHPSALAHYQARGMQIYKQETKLENLPDIAPGPWHGAR